MIILAIQSSYKGIDIGLYPLDKVTPISCISVAKDKTSTVLSTIESILADASLSIHDVSFCYVNRGPAPFTTLRTVIATANGLKAALHIPLIGLHGLDMLSSEYTFQDKQTILILNAFAGDFYYYLNSSKKGICSTAQISILIQKNTIKNIIGNGGPLIQNALPQEYAFQLIDSEKDSCHLHTLVAHGHAYIKNHVSQKDTNVYLSPLYFKEVATF